jgi:GNAT superfamily N-acetyltransferase
VARRAVTVWYLELASPEAFRPSAREHRLEFRRLSAPAPEFARFLYATVGAAYGWLDRLRWSRDEWLARLGEENRELWVAYEDGAPAGYYELVKRADGGVEVDYLGLLPHAVGQGKGSLLLGEVVRRAWALGANRVYLNTCSLDHPNALKNYLARGFTVVREEQKEREVPDEPRQLFPS